MSQSATNRETERVFFGSGLWDIVRHAAISVHSGLFRKGFVQQFVQQF